MGCDAYWLDDKQEPIYFCDDRVVNEETICCLCTFPENYSGEDLDASHVRSLALLGAAVVLMQKGYIQRGDIPDCLPRWVIDEIDRNLQLAETKPIKEPEKKVRTSNQSYDQEAE